MRINHNISAINTFRQYNANTVKSSKSMEKLSSGLRINRAADDAAGLSISEKMRGEISAKSQELRNTQDQISSIQTAEGAMNEVSSMLVRMKELITQRDNTTYDDNDRANIDLEIDQLALSVKDVKDNTKFNGINILTSATLGADALKTATDALGAVGTNAAALTAINTAITQVNTDRAKFGADQNKLEHHINSLSTNNENLQAAESRIRDVDMAEEMMEYTKNNILVQAAQSMLAQANQQPQGILQLLQ